MKLKGEECLNITNNSIAGLPFTEKIKRLTPYVVLIKIY